MAEGQLYLQDCIRFLHQTEKCIQMTIELQLTAWAVILGFVHVFVAASFSTWQRGLEWNASHRDGTAEPLGKYAQRADRVSRNFLETFVFFVAVALAVVIADRTGPQTALGTGIYVAARAIYLPVYIAGIPYLRTVIYIASIWGILQMLEVLLHRRALQTKPIERGTTTARPNPTEPRTWT